MNVRSWDLKPETLLKFLCKMVIKGILKTLFGIFVRKIALMLYYFGRYLLKADETFRTFIQNLQK